MLTVRLVDGSNFYRAALHTDSTGLTPRTLYSEVVANPQDVHIWCWDGARNNERRRALYPEYKMKRKPASEDIYRGMSFFRDVLRHSQAQQISVPAYEGDDVIATIAQKLVKDHKDVLVAIYSNDLDYAQLCVHPRIVCGATNPKKIPYDQIRLYKTFVGDTSDNIKGVKGFGDGAWDAADKDRLLSFIKSGELGDLAEAGIAKAQLNWIRENLVVLANMWTITGFFDVPADLIEKHTYLGTPNPVAAETMLREFML